MESGADVERDHALRAGLLKPLRGGFQARGRARDDGLRRRVVVRRPRVAHARERRLDLLRVEAQHRAHRGGPCRRCLGHRAPAFGHRLDHRRRVDGTGGRERAVLADRVARRGVGPVACAREQQREADAHEGQRGLRVLGEAQLIIGRVGQQVAEVDAGRGRAAVA